MPSVGPLEILMVGAIALIVYGPQRLPEIARTVGRMLSQLRQVASDVRQEFEAGMQLDDVEDEPEEPAPAPEPADPEDR